MTSFTQAKRTVVEMELPEKLLLLLCFISGYQALSIDMRRKAFIFPKESNTAFVNVTPKLQKSFGSVSVCVRFFSDYKKELCLFSMATPNHPDAFTIFKGDGTFRVYVEDQGAIFWGLPAKLNQWNSVCVTWDSSTGLTKVWVNNMPSVMKGLQSGKSISGVPKIVLGQDQDVYGGGFDKYDAFYGHLKDVHMWDKVLPYCDIMRYMDKSESVGNVINWNALEYTTHGYVVVQPDDSTSCSYPNLSA